MNDYVILCAAFIFKHYIYLLKNSSAIKKIVVLMPRSVRNMVILKYIYIYISLFDHESKLCFPMFAVSQYATYMSSMST